jgi:hypothetical protein
VVSFTPQRLYFQGKSSWYPLDRRLGGPQSHSGRGGEEKNSQPPPGIEPYNPDRAASIIKEQQQGCSKRFLLLGNEIYIYLDVG